MNAFGSALIFMLALDAAAPATQVADAAALKRTAAEAMSARRFDDAAGIYRELLSSAPDDPAILVALGAALAQGRHPDQAVAPLEHAVQLNPGLTGSARAPRLVVSGARTVSEGCRIAGACRCRSSDRRRAPPDARRGLRPLRSARGRRERASRGDDTRSEAAERLVRARPGVQRAGRQGDDHLRRSAGRFRLARVARCRRDGGAWSAHRRVLPLPARARTAAIHGEHPLCDRANLRAQRACRLGGPRAPARAARAHHVRGAPRAV